MRPPLTAQLVVIIPTSQLDKNGEWRIEPAELFRVYPPPAKAEGDRPTPEEVAALRRENELLREQLADLREDRDRWREQATRLLPAPQPEAKRAPFRRGFWRRLRGNQDDMR